MNCIDELLQRGRTLTSSGMVAWYFSLTDMPKEDRLRFWAHIERLVRNPAHPGLRNQKLSGADQRAFSITTSCRATCLPADTGIVMTAVGARTKTCWGIEIGEKSRNADSAYHLPVLPGFAPYCDLL